MINQHHGQDSMPSHKDELLSMSDEHLFTMGGCHIFAMCLADSFGYPLRILRDMSVPEPGGIVHVYCLADSDVMVDIEGHRSESEYRRAKRYDFPPYHAESITHRRIQELSVECFGRGGLYCGAGFVEAARVRAMARISSAQSKYGSAGLGANTVCAAVRAVFWILLLAGALIGCSDKKKVVLSDESGTRTLVYSFGTGFVPRAKVPEDLPILVYSFAQAQKDASEDRDFLTVKTLQNAWRERDYRNLERTIVEFRFRQLEKAAR